MMQAGQLIQAYSRLNTPNPDNRSPDTSLKILVEAFKSGRIGQVIKRTVIPMPNVPCSDWSLCNRVLVSLAGTDDARGYRQWKQVGRHVKKGCKAIYILFPQYRKVKEEDDQHDVKTESMVLAGFGAGPVFRYEDTDGEPVERPQVEPPELPPLFNVAERFGIKVHYQG